MPAIRNNNAQVGTSSWRLEDSQESWFFGSQLSPLPPTPSQPPVAGPSTFRAATPLTTTVVSDDEWSDWDGIDEDSQNLADIVEAMDEGVDFAAPVERAGRPFRLSAKAYFLTYSQVCTHVIQLIV